MCVRQVLWAGGTGAELQLWLRQCGLFILIHAPDTHTHTRTHTHARNTNYTNHTYTTKHALPSPANVI
jgi:hypothetical protein